MSSWLYRLSERYNIPVSQLELTPSEMECEIGMALGEMIIKRASDLVSMESDGKAWTKEIVALRRSDDWIDKMVLQKYNQISGKKKQA